MLPASARFAFKRRGRGGAADDLLGCAVPNEMRLELAAVAGDLRRRTPIRGRSEGGSGSGFNAWALTAQVQDSCILLAAWSCGIVQLNKTGISAAKAAG